MTINTALQAAQTFFASRAAGGEDRFAQDGPQYAHAVQELAPPLAQPSLTLAVARGARCHSCARLSAPTGR